MKLNNEKQGELFILGETALWGLFPVITILSYGKVSPLVSLAISTLLAGVFFAFMLTLKKKWFEITNIAALRDILFATFFLGILYYLFYYFGLRSTSAGNASIVALTEVFFSYLFFQVWKKQPLPFLHIIGASLMILGACIVLYPNIHTFQLGDLLILLAAFTAPFGNFYVRKARTKVSSDTIMFIRSIISASVIFLLAGAFNNTFSYGSIKNSFLFLAINGIFLLGLSKALWVEGIHRISVVKANALSSMSPLITLFSAWIFLQNVPTVWQLCSIIPMFFGMVLLGIGKKQGNNSS